MGIFGSVYTEKELIAMMEKDLPISQSKTVCVAIM
jgi:hypothetical protein